MASAFIVAFDIQEQGTAGTGVNAKKGTAIRKGEVPAGGALEMAKGAFLTVNNAKLCQIEAESQEEAMIIAGELYGNRGGVAGACTKANWEFKGGV